MSAPPPLPPAPPRTPVRLSHPDKLFIDGRWVAPLTPARLVVRTPYDQTLVAEVAAAGPQDMDLAVVAARRAFDQGPWPRLKPAERGAVLRRFAAEIERRQLELCTAWVDQVGAVAFASPMGVGGALAWANYYAGLAETFPFVEPHPVFDGQGQAYVVREPAGVVAAIAPWNAPLMIMVNKVFPALLAGCTVIMKPAPETPLDAYVLAECGEAAGLPPGVLNLVPAEREASDHLIRNPGVDKVSFTGSTGAGQHIASVCGSRVARCTLELGGKSAAIVLPDADIGQAGGTLAQTISMLCGQVCSTLSRVVVPRAMAAGFADALAGALGTVRMGNPWEPGVFMGPLAMERQLQRVQGYIERGQAEGAQLVCGGKRPAGLESGWFIEPTLFAGVRSDMTIAQEEIFGPVIALLPYDDEADALRIANDSPYGLFGAVFTADVTAAWRVARGVRTGALSHNAFKMDPFLPFGGFKRSGVGREGGTAGVLGYTETKTVLLERALPAGALA